MTCILENNFQNQIFLSYHGNMHAHGTTYELKKKEFMLNN